MKDLLKTIFASELSAWKSYNRKARAAYLYFAASFIFFAVCIMTGSLSLIVVAIANLLVSLNVGYKYIPDFTEDK